MMSRNVLEEGFSLILSYVQQYGWFAVAGVIILYFSWPSIKEFQKARSLADANDPRRRAVLDAQRLRVRLQQQKALDHTD